MPILTTRLQGGIQACEGVSWLLQYPLSECFGDFRQKDYEAKRFHYVTAIVPSNAMAHR